MSNYYFIKKQLQSNWFKRSAKALLFFFNLVYALKLVLIFVEAAHTNVAYIVAILIMFASIKIINLSFFIFIKI